MRAGKTAGLMVGLKVGMMGYLTAEQMVLPKVVQLVEMMVELSAVKLAPL